MRIRLLQKAFADDRPFDERVASVCDEVAAVRGADLVVLPELWATGYFLFDRYGGTAEPVPGPLTRRLGAAARRAGVHLHAGSVVEADARTGRMYNTSLLFDPDGDLVHTYRKFHLFGHGSEEASLLSRGSAVQPVPTGVGRLALATCYDLRFPEMFRLLAAEGAEVFVIVAAWPLVRSEHWRLLLRARALENQAYVVACNAAGVQGGVPLAGRSMVVSPNGEPVAEADEAAEDLRVRLRPGPARAVRSAREEFAALADRRLDVVAPTPADDRETGFDSPASH